jgi:hypothetical protein
MIKGILEALNATYNDAGLITESYSRMRPRIAHRFILAVLP